MAWLVMITLQLEKDKYTYSRGKYLSTDSLNVFRAERSSSKESCMVFQYLNPVKEGFLQLFRFQRLLQKHNSPSPTFLLLDDSQQQAKICQQLNDNNNIRVVFPSFDLRLEELLQLGSFTLSQLLKMSKTIVRACVLLAELGAVHGTISRQNIVKKGDNYYLAFIEYLDKETRSSDPRGLGELILQLLDSDSIEASACADRLRSVAVRLIGLKKMNQLLAAQQEINQLAQRFAVFAYEGPQRQQEKIKSTGDQREKLVSSKYFEQSDKECKQARIQALKERGLQKQPEGLGESAKKIRGLPKQQFQLEESPKKVKLQKQSLWQQSPKKTQRLPKQSQWLEDKAKISKGVPKQPEWLVDSPKKVKMPKQSQWQQSPKKSRGIPKQPEWLQDSAKKSRGIPKQPEWLQDSAKKMRSSRRSNSRTKSRGKLAMAQSQIDQHKSTTGSKPVKKQVEQAKPSLPKSKSGKGRQIPAEDIAQLRKLWQSNPASLTKEAARNVVLLMLGKVNLLLQLVN